MLANKCVYAYVCVCVTESLEAEIGRIQKRLDTYVRMATKHL